jgi:caffeoyl-CoA O-methyltransferase
MKAVPWHVRRDRADSLKYTALNDGLYRYVMECRSAGVDKVLEALRRETRKKFPGDAQMQIPRDQASFMTLLVAAIGAHAAIEVGTFTGLSSICIARGLPKNGKLLCLDLSEEWTSVAKKYWVKATVADKIELRLGPAIDSLKKLPLQPAFDFAFIDAHKPEYDDYYELILPRMNPNGLILFDNMLAGGRLGGKKPPTHPNAKAVDKLNRKLSRDPRVQSVLLPIGDGVTMCRVLG